jgi:Tfp pilus assembly protein PilO
VTQTSKKTAISTNNFIIMVIVASFLVVLLAGFVTKQLVGQIMFNNRVVSKKAAASRQLKQNLEAIPQLQSNYANLGARGQLVLDSLPSTPDFPAAVSMLEVMAGTSGVRLKSVSPGDTEVQLASAETSGQGQLASGAQPVSIRLTVEGSYDSLLSFYKNIELSSRPLKVVSIDQSGVTASQAADIGLTTYYQAPADLSPKTEVVK